MSMRERYKIALALISPWPATNFFFDIFHLD